MQIAGGLARVAPGLARIPDVVDRGHTSLLRQGHPQTKSRLSEHSHMFGVVSHLDIRSVDRK